MFFKSKKNHYESSCFGFIAGDVLGVPYEFIEREKIQYKGLVGYGTHNQPLGTWSDDTSFLYCFFAAINNEEFQLNQYKQNLIDWQYQGLFTCHQKLPFDIGQQTSKAITNLKLKKNYFDLNKEKFNGNSGLLRVFPYTLYLKQKGIKPTIENLTEFVSITNPHRISLLCCYYYSLLIWHCESTKNRKQIVNEVIHDFKQALTEKEYSNHQYKNLLEPSLLTEVKSSGFILHAVEVVLYIFLKGNNLKASLEETVLLGEDTDSNAALVGGLVAFYTNEQVKWKSKILSLKVIEDRIKNIF